MDQQLLAARTGGGAHPVEVCRQASATMPASRKQQSRKHWFVRCIPLWPSRLLGIEPLSRSDYSDALVPKCLQPKLPLLVVFGLLWLLASRVYPMSGIICSQGGHLISGQMAKAFSSAAGWGPAGALGPAIVCWVGTVVCSACSSCVACSACSACFACSLFVWSYCIALMGLVRSIVL